MVGAPGNYGLVNRMKGMVLGENSGDPKWNRAYGAYMTDARAAATEKIRLLTGGEGTGAERQAELDKLDPLTKASVDALSHVALFAPMNPMIGNFPGCCARAASGTRPRRRAA